MNIFYDDSFHILIDQQCSQEIGVRLRDGGLKVYKATGGYKVLDVLTLGKQGAIELAQRLMEAASLMPDEPTGCEFPGKVLP